MMEEPEIPDFIFTGICDTPPPDYKALYRELTAALSDRNPKLHRILMGACSPEFTECHTNVCDCGSPFAEFTDLELLDAVIELCLPDR